MVRHDDECVKVEFARVAIAEECSDKDFGGCGGLEEATTLVSYGGEGVALRFEAHGGRACPRGLKPLVSWWAIVPGLKSGAISTSLCAMNRSTNGAIGYDR